MIKYYFKVIKTEYFLIKYHSNSKEPLVLFTPFYGTKTFSVNVSDPDRNKIKIANTGQARVRGFNSHPGQIFVWWVWVFVLCLGVIYLCMYVFKTYLSMYIRCLIVMSDDRWTTLTAWLGPTGTRKRGRPRTRWAAEILKTAGYKWMEKVN